MRDRNIIARHGLNISPAAAVDYLTLKRNLLEMEVLWDVSDSAVIEYLCAKALNPDLLARDFKPKTHDGRRKENLNPEFYSSGKPRAHSEHLKGCDRIDQSILERKKTTDERLAYFKSYPARSAERRREKAQGQRRQKDVPIR